MIQQCATWLFVVIAVMHYAFAGIGAGYGTLQQHFAHCYCKTSCRMMPWLLQHAVHLYCA
jgi:hypothetical protein